MKVRNYTIEIVLKSTSGRELDGGRVTVKATSVDDARCSVMIALMNAYEDALVLNDAE